MTLLEDILRLKYESRQRSLSSVTIRPLVALVYIPKRPEIRLFPWPGQEVPVVGTNM